MQPCKNCGNENIPENSKYCNHCGVFLKLAKQPIQFKENKSSQLKSLKETLIEGSKIIDEDEDGHLSTSKNIDYYQNLVWSYLKETTNFENEMSNEITEKEFIIHIFRILNNVKYQNDEDILNEFLVEINKIYLSSKTTNNFKIKFVFYTNIELRNSIKDKFCEMLDLFNLKIFNPNNLSFENEKFKKAFKTKFIVLEYVVKGKNFYMMEKEAIKQVYLFFGYLTFLHLFRKNVDMFRANTLSLNYNLSDIKISSIFELNEDNTFIDNEFNSYCILKDSETYEKSKLIKFSNNNLFYDFYKILMKSKNKQIIYQINEYLILYYKASIEADLDISFLKFWTLSERIIKQGNDRPDSYVINYMRKILKHYKYPKSYQERIYYIKEKRNKLIHENISEITQNDRNVIKSVCDSLIWFLMEFEEYVENINEYEIFLKYFNQDNERLIEILKLINSIKENIENNQLHMDSINK